MTLPFTRRSLLKRLAGAAMLPMTMRVMSSEAASASQTILVVVELNGGNDGLNTVVPLAQYGAYAKLRPRIGLPASSLGLSFNASPTAIGAGSQYAFHPAMGQNLLASGSPAIGGLPALYQQGRLAIVVGAGLPDSDSQRLNHECARTDWYVGRPDAWNFNDNGWLGLALDNAPSGMLGPTASMSAAKKITHGVKYPGIVLGNQLSNFRSGYLSGQFPVANYPSWLAAPDNKSPLMAFSYGLSQSAFQAAEAITAINNSVSIADYPYLSPDGGTSFELQMSAVAQLIRGKAGLSGYVTELDGFDTHDDQIDVHPPLLSTLSGALANFYAYLKTYNVSSNVVVMTISDFGRTPNDNAANGTDHGQASVAFVLGDQIRGGVYGNYPSLTQLDNGLLAVTVPYQNVISDIVGAIGGNAQQILGVNFPKLGFI